jgi:hypothetical protein
MPAGYPQILFGGQLEYPKALLSRCLWIGIAMKSRVIIEFSTGTRIDQDQFTASINKEGVIACVLTIGTAACEEGAAAATIPASKCRSARLGLHLKCIWRRVKGSRMDVSTGINFLSSESGRTN